MEQDLAEQTCYINNKKNCSMSSKFTTSNSLELCASKNKTSTSSPTSDHTFDFKYDGKISSRRTFAPEETNQLLEVKGHASWKNGKPPWRGALKRITEQTVWLMTHVPLSQITQKVQQKLKFPNHYDF